jgi:cation diffusion facilitator CzcD-associated flavoprotein CzcO
MELNVWTGANVTTAAPDASNIWHVTVKQSNGQDRIFKVKHFVFATGLGVGMKMPVYPGMDDFKGELLHSTQYKKAADLAGQKVVIMGSCNSAFDVASDLYNSGKDVTMLQRGPTFVMTTKNGWKVIMDRVYSEVAPPTHIADLINASLPVTLQENIHQRYVQVLQQADKELLDGLRKRGFKLSLGTKDAGLLLLAWDKSSGYYLDVGGSQLIVDGKVKLKNDSLVERFTETGLKFEDGTEISADAIICATGLGKPNDLVRQVCGDEIANKTKQIWGLTAEGEMSGCWNDLGVPGMWYMLGNLAQARFYSKHVAIQIKAQEEGLFGTRYSSS